MPEVAEKIIEIKALAREAGYRTKVAVNSLDPKVDAVGACVGIRGSRIKNIVDELGGEKIDIVRWNDSSKILIANSLKPAEVAEIALCFELGRATVVVTEDQLSLAIGKRGQNVRLAARLTDWDMDILTPAEFNAGPGHCWKRASARSRAWTRRRSTGSSRWAWSTCWTSRRSAPSRWSTSWAWTARWPRLIVVRCAEAAKEAAAARQAAEKAKNESRRAPKGEEKPAEATEAAETAETAPTDEAQAAESTEAAPPARPRPPRRLRPPRPLSRPKMMTRINPRRTSQSARSTSRCERRGLTPGRSFRIRLMMSCIC